MDKAEEGNGHEEVRGCLLPSGNKLLCVGKVNDPLAAQQPGLMSLLCASKVVCCPLNSGRQREEAEGRCLSMRTIMDAILVLNSGYLL